MVFEAEWQLLLKWHLAYGFLPKSKHHHTLTPLQGGRCKGQSTIDQATQQIVEMELIQFNQWPALDFFLNLQYCFNYMVEACCNLACRRHGVADDYLKLLAQTHHLMKYNTFKTHPWHGAGQGAADVVLQCIALSDSLINAYHSQFQPCVLHDPTLTLQIIKSIKAFIDNVAMSAGNMCIPFLQLVEWAQSQLHWWNHLVQSSGRALNPTTNAVVHFTIGNQISMESFAWPTLPQQLA